MNVALLHTVVVVAIETAETAVVIVPVVFVTNQVDDIVKIVEDDEPSALEFVAKVASEVEGVVEFVKIAVFVSVVLASWSHGKDSEVLQVAPVKGARK